MLRVTKPVFLKKNFLSQKCPSNGFFGLIEKFGGYLLFAIFLHKSHIPYLGQNALGQSHSRIFYSTMKLPLETNEIEEICVRGLF